MGCRGVLAGAVAGAGAGAVAGAGAGAVASKFIQLGQWEPP